MRLGLVTFLALATLTCVGCGASTVPTVEHRLVGEPSEDDEEAEPFVLGAVTMPPLPVSVHASDEVVETALRLCRDAVLPERPTLSDEASGEDTVRYMREDF